MTHRIPQAPEAEAAVLGAVLLRNAAFDEDFVSDLQPDDFHAPKHRVVWEAMRTLTHGGHPIDIITLEQTIRAAGKLAIVGGLEGLGELADRYAASHNVSEHARIVAAMARARRAQRAMAEAVDRLANVDPDDVDDTIAAAHHDLDAIESGNGDGLISFADAVDAAISDARAREAGTLQPFAWGLPGLDDVFDGGMMPGELVIVAARPGMGKTVLAMCSSFASGERGEEPLAFSMEMQKQQIGRRAIASRGCIALKDAKAPPSDAAWQRVLEAREVFAKMGAKLKTGRMDIDRLVPICRRWRRRAKNPGPVVIDYLQLLEVSNRGRLQQRERIEVITRELKLLAMELEVPIVLLSQLNRDCEKREDKRPLMADLRDSGSIEQDADSVVFLYRPRRYDKDANPLAAEIIVEKIREGVPGTVHARFEGHFSRFVDTSGDAGDQPGWRYGQ